MNPLWWVVGSVFLINVPFGFWRQGVRKFSPAWFVAVHAPVPGVVALRLLSGMGFQLATLPLMLAAYFGGQLLGGILRKRRDTAPSGG